jgi:carboxymethylenebutenolidase
MTHTTERSTEAQAAPPRKTAADFHPEILRLFDRYVHGLIDRRGFLEGAARDAATAGVTAAALLEALSPRFAQAQQVPPSDARLHGQTVEAPSPAGYGTLRGYLVRPKAPAGPRPAVLVVHENRGLNPHIEDVARRFALEGFIAFAPDALAPLGGYPGDEDKARELFATLDQARTREDLVAAAQYLQSHAESNGLLGAVGFCWGGGIVNFLATRLPELKAAVPFYGIAPAAERVAGIKAPLLIHYAGNDERINAAWPGYEAALRSAGAGYEAHVYKGTQHGFHNDTTPRYDAEAARLAWQRTVDFFQRALRA